MILSARQQARAVLRGLSMLGGTAGFKPDSTKLTLLAPWAADQTVPTFNVSEDVQTTEALRARLQSHDPSGTFGNMLSLCVQSVSLP
jgi:hypothetical protein